jgi:hypothetical protein
MFWNGRSATTGTCEYKRTVGQYCYPYDNSWCDDTGPIGQGLTCTSYTNPYGNEYGRFNEIKIKKFIFSFYRCMSMFNIYVL